MKVRAWDCRITICSVGFLLQDLAMMSKPNRLATVAGCLCLLGTIPGCGECQPYIGAAVEGSVFDATGEPVVPDRVTIAGGGHSENCTIRERRDAPPTFTCFEFGESKVTVTAVVGPLTVSKNFTLEKDFCHVIPQTAELHLPAE